MLHDLEQSLANYLDAEYLRGPGSQSYARKPLVGDWCLRHLCDDVVDQMLCEKVPRGTCISGRTLRLLCFQSTVYPKDNQDIDM